MNSKILLNNVTDLTLYTGTNGRKYCTCKCIGCTQRNDEDNYAYQGNIKQIEKIIRKLPNLKNAYLLGNPDVSVDPEFCNLAANKFIENGKKVMFSTSGFNGVETLKKLTKNIDLSKIEYVSLSVDTVNEDKLKKLKGNKNITLEQIDEVINYCKKTKIPVKIQPTLWRINQDDYQELIEYFYKKHGLTWYTFHTGSFEAIEDEKIDILKHIKPEKSVEIREKLIRIAQKYNLKMNIPKVFITKEEYDLYDNSNTYCRVGGRGLQIWLTRDALKCTFCPILTKVNKNYFFNIDDEDIKLLNPKLDCPIANNCISNDLKQISEDNKGNIIFQNNKKYFNICRYFSKKIKY